MATKWSTNCLDFKRDSQLFDYCVATYVLAAAVVLVPLSIVAIICSCRLFRKRYRFRFIKCSCKVIHCLCCSCEIKELQPEPDPDGPPIPGGLTQSNGSSGHYERVVEHNVAHGSLGNRNPEPLPRPLSPTLVPIPTRTGSTEDDGERPRTISVDNNYIEFVEPDARADSASNDMLPPLVPKQSSTLKKRVTKEEVVPHARGGRRLATDTEEDEVPLLADTVDKGGYQSTEFLQPQLTRTLPTDGYLALKHTSALYQKEAHDGGGGRLSPLPSSDAASSDDTRSSNPAAVHEFSRSSPA